MSKLKRSSDDASIGHETSSIQPKKPKTDHILSTLPQEVSGAQVQSLSEVQLARKKLKQERKQQKRAGEIGTQDLQNAWTLSAPVGGRLADIDSVFSLDEKHILIPYTDGVKVYSCGTSLPVRSLFQRKKGPLVAIALSASDPSKVYLARKFGRLELWDWETGSKVTTWDLKSRIFDISVSALEDPDSRDIVFVSDRTQNKISITAHLFQRPGSDKGTEVRTLFETLGPVRRIQTRHDGQFIVATLDQSIVIGSRSTSAMPEDLESLKYVWRELPYTRRISTVDSYVANQSIKGSRNPKSPQLHVAIGTDDGAIYLYRDIVTQLIQVGKRNQSSPNSSKRHWHRSVVGAVKWSKDGNYMISGGQETVLIIWQLDTGKSQTLPHLASAIENIVVSPSGTSYALRLADNSVMVLSTLELEPTVSVTGLHLPDASPLEANASEDMFSSRLLRRRPAVTSSADSQHILLSVPATVSSRRGTAQSKSSPYLQVVESKSGQQLLRQALVRTYVTDVNTAPNGSLIIEPNVVFVETSCSGKWMATVDEWARPEKDLEHLSFNKSSLIRNREKFLEIYLKFWHWNDETNSWELSWRVEAPHKPSQTNTASLGRILDLTYDPSKDGFFSLGDDGSIKSWFPSLRRRHGQLVKDKNSSVLSNWSGQQVGYFPTSRDDTQSKDTWRLSGRVTVSLDGTVVAASLDTASWTQVRIYCLEGNNVGEPAIIEHPTGPLIGLGLVDRYLVTFGQNLEVYDLVDNRPHFCIKLSNVHEAKDMPFPTNHLAVDQRNGTFAIVRHDARDPKAKSRLDILDPSKPVPIYSAMQPAPVYALLPASSQKSYLTIDTQSEIRTLNPVKQLMLPETSEPEAPTQTFTALDSVFTTLPDSSKTAEREQQRLTVRNGEEGTQAASRPLLGSADHQAISDLWNNRSAMALPSTSELFAQVAAIVAPRQRKQDES